MIDTSEIDRAFYDLVVAQRDAAWCEVAALRAEIAKLQDELASNYGRGHVPDNETTEKAYCAVAVELGKILGEL